MSINLLLANIATKNNTNKHNVHQLVNIIYI